MAIWSTKPVASEDPPIKSRAESLQEFLLRGVFLAMLAATGTVLYQDYQLLEREAATNRYQDRLELLPMQPVAPRDQVRPYLPSTRPVGPDRSAPNLAPFDLPDDSALKDPMRFQMDGEGRLLAHGTITPGTADVFDQALLGREEAVTEIVLHSPGGYVRDALAMSRMIREKGLNTTVLADGYCASSCPLLLAGGVTRSAGDGAWIGVHQVYPAASSLGDLAQGMDQAQRVSAQAQSLLVEMDVDPAVWIHAMETPKEQLYVLTAEELETYRLANHHVAEKDEGTGSGSAAVPDPDPGPGAG